MIKSLNRMIPALAAFGLILATLPAQAGYEELDVEGSSLSGSYLAGRFAGKQRDMDAAGQYFQ